MFHSLSTIYASVLVGVYPRSKGQFLDLTKFYRSILGLRSEGQIWYLSAIRRSICLGSI